MNHRNYLSALMSCTQGLMALCHSWKARNLLEFSEMSIAYNFVNTSCIHIRKTHIVLEFFQSYKLSIFIHTAILRNDSNFALMDSLHVLYKIACTVLI